MLTGKEPDGHRVEHRNPPQTAIRRGPGQPKYAVPADQLERVLSSIRRGASEVSIARALGINYRTWGRLKAEDERIASAMAECRKVEEDELVSILIDKARAGDTTALIFALKGRHGYRDQGTPQGIEQRVNVTISLPAAQATIGDYMKTIEGIAS